MSSLDSALKGFYMRASADVDMKTILGTKTSVGSARIFDEVVEKELRGFFHYGKRPGQKRAVGLEEIVLPQMR